MQANHRGSSREMIVKFPISNYKRRFAAVCLVWNDTSINAVPAFLSQITERSVWVCERKCCSVDPFSTSCVAENPAGL